MHSHATMPAIELPSTNVAISPHELGGPDDLTENVSRSGPVGCCRIYCRGTASFASRQEGDAANKLLAEAFQTLGDVQKRERGRTRSKQISTEAHRTFSLTATAPSEVGRMSAASEFWNTYFA